MVREAHQERADRISQYRQTALETYAASDGGGGIDLAADRVTCDREAQPRRAPITRATRARIHVAGAHDGADTDEASEARGVAPSDVAVERELLWELPPEEVLIVEGRRRVPREDTRRVEGTEAVDRKDGCLGGAPDEPIELLLAGPVLANAHASWGSLR